MYSLYKITSWSEDSLQTALVYCGKATKVAGDGMCHLVKAVKLVYIYTLTLGTRIIK